MRNDGVSSTGDHHQIFNNVEFGSGTHMAATPQRRPGSWEIGVITVISSETRAVLDVLRRARRCDERILDGRVFYEAQLNAGGSPIGVVATQALEPGQRQAGAAYQHLRKWYAPPVIAIVGIAGGIHPDVEPGDVVIATRIVYYDSRREDPDQTRLRGESHDPPPATQHAINAFFSWWGEPAVLRRRDRGRPVVFRAVPGLIGSGEAVVRGRNHQAGGLPHRYQDKILAIETEGAGLAHAFHEDRDAQAPPRGWVVVRGISDKANRGRDDAYHADASHNAAHVFAMLVPYLISREGG